MFLNSMFQSMFTGIDGDGPFGGSGAAGVWRSMLTDQYARSFAKAGGIGIAAHVYQSLLGPPGAATMTMPADQSIGTAAEAERAIASLNTIMDRLIETVEEETARMRKGRLRDALALETQKQELAPRLCGRERRS